MNKTKLLSIILIITMLINFLPPLFSYANDSAKIEVVNHAGDEEILVAPGETFSIDVNFTKSSKDGLALSGALKFDTSKLEIVNKKQVSSSELYNISKLTGITNIGADINRTQWDSSTEKANNIFFMYQGDTDPVVSGTAFRVEFKVKEGATGSFDFEFYNIKYLDDANNSDATELSIDSSSTLTGKIKTPLTSISLNKTEATVGIDETDKLTVSYNPENTTDTKEITWKSSNDSIVTVDSEGNIKGIAPGTATITATSKVTGVDSVTCEVTVTSKLQSISINKTLLEMAKGQSETLKITFNPTNTTDSKDIVWTSSNSAIATVDAEGKVTAIENGETTITASSVVTGIEAVTCKVEVTTKLQSISLNENEFNMNKNATKKLTVSYNPVDTTDDKTVTWSSSDNAIAKVAADGTITAVAPGTATITANCNGKVATATVTVKSPLTSITISGGDRELLPEQEVDLDVTYDPEDTTDSKTIVWTSSDTTIATVDSNGKVIGLKPGTVTITATCGNITDTISVKVNEVHTESIAFKNEEVTINKNATSQAEIIFYPENTTDDKTISWSSSDETVVTVDENGKITAIAAGTATVTAKAGEKTATCEVTVKVPLTGITLDDEKVELEKGSTKILVVKYNEDDTTDDKTVTWSSLNEKVATVDKDGKITAIAAGTAVIKAQVGDHVVTCEVTVKVPLTGISIKESTTLIKNQTETLVVTYEPEDTTDDKTVIWSSSDETVATVDKNGKVTGLKEGTVVITAKVGTYEAECDVEVKEIKLEGIAISNKIDEVLKGQEVTLEVIFTPEDTTDEKVIEWLSSDESIVTVDENGKIVGIRAGKATITAISGTFEATYEVEIKEVPITGMEIKVDSTTLKEGEELKLNVNFTPENTTDSKDLKYVSSDETIAVIDENGKVTAKKAGKVVITAIAENGVETQIELTIEEKVNEEANAGTNVDSPKTGDMNIILYVILMIVSLIGIIKIRKNEK